MNGGIETLDVSSKTLSPLSNKSFRLPSVLGLVYVMLSDVCLRAWPLRVWTLDVRRGVSLLLLVTLTAAVGFAASAAVSLSGEW
jgi:hypothetical protein